MRNSQRETDFLWLAIVVLALALVAPLWLRRGLPATAEAQQQIVRALEMSRSIQAGILYPRWAPDFNYGYGSPLWNYLAPLPHWLAGLFHALVQTEPANAVKAVITLSSVVGVLGSFSFVRRRWGSYAGILAALGYGLAPSAVWDTPLVSSDVGTLLAVGIFLSALWSYDCLLTTGHRRDLVFATLLTTALWLAQTPLNLVLAAILAGWILYSTRLSPPPKKAVLQGVLAWILGLLLSSFYLIPALWEADLIRWQAATPWPLTDWHPVSLRTLLTLPPRLDLSAANPPGTGRIGVAVWGLAMLSIGVALYQDWRKVPGPAQRVSRGEAWQARLAALPRYIPSAHREMVYFAVVALLCGTACTSLGSALWEHIPPWLAWSPRDLVTLVACMGAFVLAQGGQALQQMRSGRTGFAGLAGCAGLLLLAALPTLALPAWPEARIPATIQDVLRDEGRGYLVSSFFDGWLLPAHLNSLPQPSPSLMASYQTGYVDIVARDRLPSATQVDVIESGPQSQRLAVSARQSVVLVLYVLYFPGWQASVDETHVPVFADAQTGFVSLEVPAGRHEVRLTFGSTLERDIGWGISMLALMLLGGLVLWRDLEPKPSSLTESTRMLPEDGETRPTSLATGGLVIGLAIIVIAARIVPGPLARQSPPGVVEAAVSFPRAFQGGVDLLAYELDAPPQLQPGDRLTLHLYWRAVQPDLPDYQAEVSLISATGAGSQLWLTAQHRHPGGIPTSRWTWWPLLKNYLRDSYYLTLPTQMPAGTYQFTIRMGACTLSSIAPCAAITPLFVYDGRGSRLGNQVTLPVAVVVSEREN